MSELPGKTISHYTIARRLRSGGMGVADWARKDTDLSLLHGDPEFEKLYPEPAAR